MLQTSPEIRFHLLCHYVYNHNHYNRVISLINSGVDIRQNNNYIFKLAIISKNMDAINILLEAIKLPKTDKQLFLHNITKSNILNGIVYNTTDE